MNRDSLPVLVLCGDDEEIGEDKEVVLHFVWHHATATFVQLEPFDGTLSL